MYGNYEIKKLDSGKFAAYTLLDYSNCSGIDTNIMLCEADTKEELGEKLELMQKAFKNGVLAGACKTKDHIKYILDLW